MNKTIEIDKITPAPLKIIECHNVVNAYVGKDILELLSVSMYVEPLTIYREYIQNATDSIDAACEEGLIKDVFNCEISITINQNDRSIVIRDNGIGIKRDNFERLMVSLGDSPKRGKSSRGFRGVGRFAGLALCQNLIFRTKAEGENVISEISWDGRKFKTILNDNNQPRNLEELISEIATISTYKTSQVSDHFFEVALQKVVRTKNDALLNEESIEIYLSQVCPVPYRDEFVMKEEIEEFMLEYDIQPGYWITLTSDYEDNKQIFRPYKNRFSISQVVTDKILGIEKFKLKGAHNGCAAIGWLYKHNYKGVIPSHQNIRGIRLRVGNIQIGDEALLAETFPEARFNSWSIGEVHVLEPKILPNGRRDNFENNVHWLGVQSQFAPFAKEIAKTCRKFSYERNIVKTFDLNEEKINHLISVLNQRALSISRLKKVRKELFLVLLCMNKACEIKGISDATKSGLTTRYTAICDNVSKFDLASGNNHEFFTSLPKGKQTAFKEIFDLIYDCSPNRVVAKSLLDKIMNAYQSNKL